jgi:ABC-2 type transport system permease protein
LLDVVPVNTPLDGDAARRMVDEGQAAVAVIIPAGFSEAIVPGDWRGVVASSGQAVAVEVYGRSDARYSTLVVQNVVSRVLVRMSTITRGITAAATWLAMPGATSPAVQPEALATDLGVFGQAVGQDLADGQSLVQLRVGTAGGRPFSWLDYMAGTMAVLFLMFSVTAGGRTILAEVEQGTLSRLRITPTPPLTILVGKMSGVALTGILQMAVLWGATTLFGAYWGAPNIVPVVIVLLVLCATGVAAIIAAWARSPGQGRAIASAVSLVAAAASGSFVPRSQLPVWLQQISLISPNAWGIEILSRLQAGGDWAAVLPALGGMAVLTLVYYVVASIGFRRIFR